MSHPIQHFVPLYRALAARSDVQLCVFYASRVGLDRYFDNEMQTEIAWKIDLLADYPHVFLPGADAAKRSDLLARLDPDLGQALCEFDPDTVMVYGYSMAVARRAARWANDNRRRLIMISDSELRDPRPLLKRIAKQFIVRRHYARVDAFLAVGDENARYYRHYGAPPERIFRSPFTIDETSYREAATRREAARADLIERHHLPDDALLALFVGKLSNRKRPQDLVEAVARLRDRAARPVHALLAGGGELADELAERISSEGIPAHLLGFVNVDVLPMLYAGCDVLVHTSQADPHPLVCSEAACIGLPMVLSDRIGAEGPTDIARRGENAFVYKCGDVSALADILARLADEPATISSYGARSRELFEGQSLIVSVAGILAAMDVQSRRRA